MRNISSTSVCLYLEKKTSNTYEMEGSSGSVALYELWSRDQINNCHFEVPGNQLPKFDGQLEPFRWPQGSDFRPPYSEGMATGCAPDPSCMFRSEVLDDCAKARFYARALEICLVENETPNAYRRCLLAACGAQFNNTKDMLKHLKHCKKFGDGTFWCPPCHRYESFRVRTGKRCSWDKDHLGRRLLQKSKSVFRSFGNNDLAAQPTPTYTSCPRCSAQLSTLPMLGSDDVPPHQVCPRPAIEPPMPQELYSCPQIQELSGSSSCENSPSQPWPQPMYTYPRSASAVSSASTSSNENSIISNISPASSTHRAMTPSTRRHTFMSIPSNATNRGTGFCGEPDASNHTLNPRYSGVSASLGLCPLVPTMNVGNIEPFIAPSTLLSTFAQRPSFHEAPKLRIDTAPGCLDLVMPGQDIEALFPTSRTLDHSTTTENLEATSLPTGAIDTQASEAYLFDAIVSGNDPFAAQPDLEIAPSSPASVTSTFASESSPTAASPKQELRCPVCDFKPKKNKMSYLKKHMKKHGDRRRIPCPGSKECTRTFTRQDNLTTHLRNYHPKYFSLFLSKKTRSGSDSSRLAPDLKKRRLRTEELESPFE